MDDIIIRIPTTKAEYEAYYYLRWQLLRAPWDQPKGSEKDELEDIACHFMAISSLDGVVGVCRLHQLNEEEGQIRYMAVAMPFRGHGIGHRLLEAAELKARTLHLKSLLLQSRESAVEFYKREGYTVLEKSFIMYHSIQHYLMKKDF